MTAVATQLSFQPSTRLGWGASNGTSNGNGYSTMSSDDVTKTFTPGARKTVQRQNSSSSLASTNSTSSTTSTSTINSAQTNGASSATSSEGSWATRKKPARGLWPPGKAEPATGITTTRPQAVGSATSGPAASSAISALHTPLLPSQQMANGTPNQTNGAARPQASANSNDPQPILHLLPMNGTFERKTINVPYWPEQLKIGRQTNQKTIPAPSNGFFDSKVLSRQHAEVWADRQGRVFIKDVKSSNGTFVNGMRLSPENKESEPRELREQDVLELGIDIVSEDQKTVVHHKVAAKVEHAGLYAQSNDSLNFGELDPSVSGGVLASPHQLKRAGSQGQLNGRVVNGMPGAVQQPLSAGVPGQPQHMRAWLNPITTEQIVKKLNAEMKLALRQSQELARARQMIDHMLAGGRSEQPPPIKEPKLSDKIRPSPTKSKLDLKSHFSEPPAPPPQAPLPEKPDVARALADPIIRPLLRRDDTTLPMSNSASPTRVDHSGDILRLCEELKLAKGELSNQSERMKNLEHELAQERTARESAEERAQRFERRDSPLKDDEGAAGTDTRDGAAVPAPQTSPPLDLQTQLDRLRTSMDDMKQQMERYRARAESAESERDEARRTLAELIEEKRKENAASPPTSPTRTRKSPSATQPSSPISVAGMLNGHAVSPAAAAPGSPTSDVLLERAGIEEGQPITFEQARKMTELLSQEVLHLQSSDGVGDGKLSYYGQPVAGALAVILLGTWVMGWMNGWVPVKGER